MNTDRHRKIKIQNPNHKIQTSTNVQNSNVKNYFWNVFWICLGFDALEFGIFSESVCISVYLWFQTLTNGENNTLTIDEHR